VVAIVQDTINFQTFAKASTSYRKLHPSKSYIILSGITVETNSHFRIAVSCTVHEISQWKHSTVVWANGIARLWSHECTAMQLHTWLLRGYHKQIGHQTADFWGVLLFASISMPIRCDPLLKDIREALWVLTMTWIAAGWLGIQIINKRLLF